MSERAVDRTEFREQTSVPSRVCIVVGCNKTTREKKPWCPDHVETHAPPAIRILGELQKRKQEIKDIGEGKPVDATGHLAAEARRLLREKAVTAAGLARDLSIPVDVAEAIVRYLVVTRLARESRVRGKIAASLNVRSVG